MPVPGEPRLRLAVGPALAACEVASRTRLTAADRLCSPVPLYRRPRFFTDAQWDEYAQRVDAFARYTLSRGVRLAYHHHMGAYVETSADVDRLMERTSDAVGLLFDTGHITFAGGDPLELLDKHIARVCHVHCKDVRPAVVRLARNRNWSFLDAVVNGAFTVPGDGTVDFPSIVGRLKQHGYRGWLVVEAEQDPVIAPSFAYAQKGYRTLRALGLMRMTLITSM